MKYTDRFKDRRWGYQVKQGKQEPTSDRKKLVALIRKYPDFKATFIRRLAEKDLNQVPAVNTIRKIIDEVRS